MNFMFFIYIPLVHSVSHRFMTTYTGLNGQVVAGTPEISAVTTLDEQQIDHYNSDTGTLIQDWMKEFASGDRWKKYTKIRERVQQISKQFSQSHGVHMYQRKYGCDWDDKTEVSHGFDEYNYDGQHFISLNLEEGRYKANVPQAKLTVKKWNDDREQLDFLKHFYKHECIDWLKEFLNFSKATLKKIDIVGVELSGHNLTKPIQNNLTVNHTENSRSALYKYLFPVIIIIFILIALILKSPKKPPRKLFRFNGPQHRNDENGPILENPLPHRSPQPYPTTESFNKDQETP